ncbi:MAG: acylphosphatase [Spirochaetes bacterium]|nr:acylphosphatase [Spirochaetota bacterium]
MKAFHAVIEGEVQGVGFRYSALREARSLGLAGWVRNRGDGAVEVWAEGSEQDLEVFAEWLKAGPAEAWVRNFELSWEAPGGALSSFNVAF